ncbi:glycosyltransferase family 4 protein [Stakelama saccharophila]|uniref:Glycosyltransferase n=1 Tax=Stakelama saccharophila TaxID=3075605 RepID=A0ABZ0B924_9SPHN|nr:glycosyltransferase [Stakelama sp. W311]WNO53790.1 glycosyltransferase [Stakelama sp. W311]
MSTIIHVQPAMPSYRLDFFDRSDLLLSKRLLVYATRSNMGILTQQKVRRPWLRDVGKIVKILPGLYWQRGVASIPFSQRDIIVISGNPRVLSNILLLARARLRGARTIWWGHYWSSTSKKWRQALRRIMMRASDAILFYTDSEAVEYCALGTRNQLQLVSALNNGIDVSAIRPVREPYRAESRDLAALFVGRITEKAELSLALDALAQPEMRGITLHIVGWGHLAPELIEKTRSMGLDKQVHWHGAMNQEAEIAKIANRCRLFLYPGEVGLSLIHGMAYGLPAVVHSDRRKQMPEIAAFIDDETGRSFCRGEPASLAAVVSDAVRDTEQLNRWSERCIHQADENFNTQAMAHRFVTLIQRLESMHLSPADLN